jgi:hypothetical protein
MRAGREVAVTDAGEIVFHGPSLIAAGSKPVG